MSSVKQLLGFPHLHPAAQHSRCDDCMPTSLSGGLHPPFFSAHYSHPSPVAVAPSRALSLRTPRGRPSGWPAQLT